MSERELHDLFSSAVDDLPPDRDVIARAETRGRVVVRRRRILAGVGGLGLVTAAAVAVVGVWPTATVSTQTAHPPTASATRPAPTTPSRDAAAVRQAALLTEADLEADGSVWAVASPDPQTCWGPSKTMPAGYDSRFFTADPEGSALTAIATETDAAAAAGRVAGVGQAIRDCLQPAALRTTETSLWRALQVSDLPGAPSAKLYTFQLTCLNPADGCDIQNEWVGVAAVGSEVLYLEVGGMGGVTEAQAGAAFSRALDKLKSAQG